VRQRNTIAPADIERLRQARSPGGAELFDGEGGATWAVAYADLLMVLMSFFIIYFSMGSEGIDQTMYKIAVKMKGVTGFQGNGTENGSAAGQESCAASAGSPGCLGNGFSAGVGPSISGQVVKPGLPEGLFELLKRHQFKYLEQRNQVSVLLDEHAFGPGRFAVTRDLGAQLQSIAESLVPFKDTIEVTVVGHADTTRMVPRNEYLRDNFDLSSLRAREALRVLIQNGIPEEILTIQGASSNEVAARSLTLRIRRKGDKK
jgi:flagellar motor protein MotB